MMYVRGDYKIYDQWRDLGNFGWGSKEVLEYFKKSERNNNPEYVATGYHSDAGYLSVEQAPHFSKLADTFVNAGVELGYPLTDLNGQNQNGFMIAQSTVRNGRRCSTAKAFLQPARNRPNLHISMESYVTKIITTIESSKNHAIGVEYYRDGKLRISRASKEVIISAGSIRSPQLLMLSGIGQQKELSKHQIPIIQNLAVGVGLQDHTLFGGLIIAVNEELGTFAENIEDAFDYAINSRGPLSDVYIKATALLKTKYAKDNIPDMQLLTYGFKNTPETGDALEKNTGLSKQFYNSVFAPLLVGNISLLNIIPTLVLPKSMGTIKLKSNNPYEPPLFNPNYLSDKSDVKVLVEGIKLVLSLLNTSAFKKYQAYLPAYVYPNCRHTKVFSDAYFECIIPYFSASVSHAVGTCKMGPSNDKNAVVDPTLRVYGVDRLRVIDASIMPSMVNMNTNAATIMIAEKGADMIISEWNA